MTNKVAIVTGSARGIGRGVALELADAGYDIVTNGVSDSDDLKSITKEIIDKGRKAQAVQVDISDLSAHKKLIDAATNLGEIHCLVNNAGVSVLSRGDLLDVTTESYDHCQNINTRGTFFLTQQLAKTLVNEEPSIEGHRSIVYVTSINAIASSINRGEYCMSKAATSAAVRLFALRLAEAGIGVYEIQAGLIKTDMSAASRDKYDKMIAEGFLPIPRWGLPEDIGKLTVSMANGDMQYSIGQAIQLDGGLATVRF